MDIEKYIILSDAQLVVLALDGDAMAFETLVQRYREGIYTLFLHRTGGNKEDSNDLVQESILKIYLNLQKYNPQFGFGQWAYTIARNTFIDYVRRRRDELSIDQLGNAAPSLTPSFDESADQHLINEQHNVQLERCMAALPEKYRTMVEMRFMRDLSYEEIAAQLAIPIGTVKTQIHRARERLCKLLAENKVES